MPFDRQNYLIIDLENNTIKGKARAGDIRKKGLIMASADEGE